MGLLSFVGPAWSAQSREFVSRGMLEVLARQGRLSADLMATLPRVLIVGEGGAGKSTLLEQLLARAAATGNVPVWVSLAHLPADAPLTIAVLLDHLVREAHVRLGVGEVNRAFFESLVADGRLAIGFDALDECGSLPQRQRVRGLIEEVAREWKRCQVIVTSRPEALHDTPLPLITPADPKDERFRALTPRPFTRDDIAPFLRVAFDDGDKLAATLLNRTGIEALTATPLTLTLVGLVARTPKGLPATRTPLFARCLDTVCETWEAAKGAQPPPDGLDATQRLDVLRRLGWAAQAAGGDELDADAARVAIASSPDRDVAARAERVLAGLARRNLLLRAQAADDGSFELLRLRFSHPQFREYLAGAHLAEQFALDAVAAAAAMAPHWLDTRWLDVLRFAVASVESRPARRDALLRAALAAPDPYRDLLRRPEFLVAQLLTRLPQADAAIVGDVAACLERTAINEPALRDDAAQALLDLRRHAPALPAIERFALGGGAALAFAERAEESNEDHRRWEPLRWRLRAIEALAPARGNAAALALLQPLQASGLRTALEVAKSRRRLGDVDAARADLKRLFDAVVDEVERAFVAAAMDEVGEGERFNGWLTALLDADVPTTAQARLARERRVLADDAPAWTRMFERATAELDAIDPDDGTQQVSRESWAVVEAAIDLVDGAALEAGRALLVASLPHRLLVWRVGPHVLKVLRSHAAQAITCLKEFVIKGLSLPYGYWLDGSSLSAAVQAICDESDDALAVPALLELLQHFDGKYENWPHSVVASLARRGQADAVLALLRPLLELPAGVHDGRHDKGAALRSMAWALVNTLGRKHAHTLLDTMYRAGEPAADAQRLMGIWNISGVGAVGCDWLESLGAHKDDPRVKEFLFTLTTHERDTAFTDFARQALGGNVFDRGEEDEPERTAPLTTAALESEFAWAMENGWYHDERGRRRGADASGVARLLGKNADSAGRETALRLADSWLRRAGIDDAMSARAMADLLVERLHALGQRGLRNPSWCEPAADLARAIEPAHRGDLLEWLRANV